MYCATLFVNEDLFTFNPMTPHWSDGFFEGPWVPLHLSFRSPGDIARESEAVVAFLDLPTGCSVVDIPCGPGDHAIELARRGFHVTGIDRSEVLLEHAKRRASKAAVQAVFEHGDMRDVRLGKSFDALLCMWGSVGYFDNAGDRAQIETFWNLLRPGGVMLIDISPLEGILLNFEPRDTHRVGSMLVIQERSYDGLRQCIDARWTFEEQGQRIVKHTSMRLYTVRQWREFLETIGFEDVQIIDPQTGSAFALGSFHAWIRARRP